MFKVDTVIIFDSDVYVTVDHDLDIAIVVQDSGILGLNVDVLKGKYHVFKMSYPFCGLGIGHGTVCLEELSVIENYVVTDTYTVTGISAVDVSAIGTDTVISEVVSY